MGEDIKCWYCNKVFRPADYRRRGYGEHAKQCALDAFSHHVMYDCAVLKGLGKTKGG